MIGKILFLIFQVMLITKHAHGHELKKAILGREEGAAYSNFPITKLTFETKIIGRPKDFHSTNQHHINRIYYPEIGNMKISLVNLDVVGRFTYHHIPAQTTFENIADVKSIKDLELILGRPLYRSGTQAEWGFFSSDGKSSYVFEFYVASFDEDSHEIYGIRYGVAVWSN